MELIYCDFCLHVSLDYAFAYNYQMMYRGYVYDILSHRYTKGCQHICEFDLQDPLMRL